MGRYFIMSETELFGLWLENATEDPDLQEELNKIKGDDEAVLDRFYRDLEFGTGGRYPMRQVFHL